MTNDATRDALVEKVAEAIHDARYGPDYPPHLVRGWQDEYNSGREYCFRLARAAIEAVGQQPRETAPDIDQDEYVLPCDVRLPPSTVICAGVKLRTLIDALDYRRNAGVVHFREASPALNSQDTTTHIVALEAVAKAAREMPRATPAAGHATTEHDFKIPAHAVWALDLALKQLDAEGVEG